MNKFKAFEKELVKNLAKSADISARKLRKIYKKDVSWSAEFLKMEFAMIEHNKNIMEPFWNSVFCTWKLSELGEFETMTEYNGFLVEV